MSAAQVSRGRLRRRVISVRRFRWIKRKYFERVGTRDWWFFGESAIDGEANASASLIVEHLGCGVPGAQSLAA